MKYFKSILTLLVFTGLTTAATAQSGVFANGQNVAIGGYDVVAYFNSYEAVRGNNEYVVVLDDVNYYFSSAENAAAFKESPQAFLPQFGGYCAAAMATNGSKVPSDPETFKLRDGKLYLFFNDYYEGKPFNTIVLWNGDEPGMVANANINWENQK